MSAQCEPLAVDTLLETHNLALDDAETAADSLQLVLPLFAGHYACLNLSLSVPLWLCHNR